MSIEQIKRAQIVYDGDTVIVDIPVVKDGALLAGFEIQNVNDSVGIQISVRTPQDAHAKAITCSVNVDENLSAPIDPRKYSFARNVEINYPDCDSACLTAMVSGNRHHTDGSIGSLSHKFTSFHLSNRPDYDDGDEEHNRKFAKDHENFLDHLSTYRELEGTHVQLNTHETFPSCVIVTQYARYIEGDDTPIDKDNRKSTLDTYAEELSQRTNASEPPNE